MSMKICMISLSRIADDLRVRRHGGALADAGYDVVGIFSHRGESPQVRHAVPNKVFQYTMAGLALWVSTGPVPANVVSSHNLRVLTGGDHPEDVAPAIHSLSPRDITTEDEHNQAAAKERRWEVPLEAVRTRVVGRSHR